MIGLPYVSMVSGAFHLEPAFEQLLGLGHLES